METENLDSEVSTSISSLLFRMIEYEHNNSSSDDSSSSSEESNSSLEDVLVALNNDDFSSQEVHHKNGTRVESRDLDQDEHSYGYVFTADEDCRIQSLDEKNDEPKSKRIRIEKVKGFLTEIIPGLDEKEFKNLFKISRTSLRKIISTISKDYYDEESVRPKAPCQYAVLVTLWYMATTESVSSIGEKFDFDKHQVQTLSMTICELMLLHMHEWLRWPQKGSHALDTIQQFNEMPGNRVRGIMGCVGNVQLPVKPPSLNDQSYLNELNRSSHHLIAVCDAHKKFIYVFGGWPGSEHESQAWIASSLYKKLELEKDEFVPPGAFLISKPSFQLRSFNITPFEKDSPAKPLNRAQKKFNDNMYHVLTTIEEAFTRLRTLFPRLNNLSFVKLGNAVKLSQLGCILHNISIDDGVGIEYCFKYDKKITEQDGKRPRRENQGDCCDEKVMEDMQNAVKIRDALVAVYT